MVGRGTVGQDAEGQSGVGQDTVGPGRGAAGGRGQGPALHNKSMT